MREATVKSVEHKIETVISHTVLTIIELITISNKMKYMLNSRPLALPYSYPYGVICPDFRLFLVGASLATVAEPDVEERPYSRLEH